MNIINAYKIGLAVLLTATATTSCVQDDDFNTPPIICEDAWTSNTDLQTVKAMNTSEPTLITEDLVFEGYVVSSDEAGSFYKTVSIQNDFTNPTEAIQVEINKTGLYGEFPVGSRVFVNAKGLYIAKSLGPVKLGSTYVSNGEIRLGRFDGDDLYNHVRRACGEPVEIVPTEYDNISDALTESNLNTLIKLNNVQFSESGNGATYYDENSDFGGSTNRYIEDQSGNRLAIRTSEFADFAAEELPEGSGSITLVLSAYDTNGSLTSSDFQGYIRSTNDVDLDGSRILTSIPYTQEFNSNIPSDWELINEVGDRLWEAKEYGGVKYAQNSAYSSGGAVDMVSWMITNPFDFDAQDNEQMILNVADAYSNGNPLKVYYSTDYTPGSDVTNATWTRVGEDEIAALNQNDSGYDNIYEPTAPIDLSGINGVAHIAFVYDSEGGSITTTVQMSSVIIQ